jgi:hypothetical protein
MGGPSASIFACAVDNLPTRRRLASFALLRLAIF